MTFDKKTGWQITIEPEVVIGKIFNDDLTWFKSEAFMKLTFDIGPDTFATMDLNLAYPVEYVGDENVVDAKARSLGELKKRLESIIAAIAAQ